MKARHIILQVLLHDHSVIMELLDMIKPLLLKAASDPADIALDEWAVLREKGLAFAAELSTHAAKEEMAMLPAIDQILTAEQAQAAFDMHQSGAA